MSSFFSYKHEVQVVNCELFLYYNFNLALDDLACEVLGLFNIDEDWGKIIVWPGAARRSHN